jgi:ribosomal protein L35
MKGNKSFTKRLRMTKNGKIVARAPGQNHFNAKEGGGGHMRRKRAVDFAMNAENRSRFFPRTS